MLGVAALAACESDKSFAPTADQLPTSAALARGTKGGGGSLKIVLVNKLLGPLSEPGATFTGTKSGQLKFTITDNGPDDADPTVGIVEVTGLTGGTYTVCQTVAPAGYIRNTGCPATGLGGNTPPSVTFVNVKEPHGVWAVIDIISKDTIGGATFTVDNLDGSPLITVADNSPLDLDPRPGVFNVKSDQERTVSVCLKSPPPGYVVSDASDCFEGTLSSEQVQLADLNVHVTYFIYWSAGTDAGSTVDGTFSVTGPNGFSIIVIGNGQNDLAKNAQYYVKVPSTGSYTVCQTVIPAGTQADEQPCRQIDVGAGWPYVGQFYNTTP